MTGMVPIEDEGAAGAVEAALGPITDAIETGFTGLPAPVRKGFLKAFNRLCSAAVEVPVAYLEGKGAEIRAATAARVQIQAASAEQIAAQLKVDPKYVVAAAEKSAAKIVGRQLNVDKTMVAAYEQLAAPPPGAEQKNPQELPAPDGQQVAEVSDDWLNAFEAEAAKMSSDQMRLLFGKILAGEISNPGAYSIRTVKLLSQLDNNAARLFTLLCSAAVSLQVGPTVLDARVVSFGQAAAQNGLRQFGLSFDNLNLLAEYGLIISDYNSYFGYSMAIAKGGVVRHPLIFQNRRIAFVERAGVNVGEFRVNGVALTKAGKELLPIVTLNPVPEYEAALHAYFNGLGLDIATIQN